MEDLRSLNPVKKHDMLKMIVTILSALLFVAVIVGGFAGFFLIPILVLTVSFYGIIVIARKIIPERYVVLRALFVSFFGIILAVVLVSLWAFFFYRPI